MDDSVNQGILYLWHNWLQKHGEKYVNIVCQFSPWSIVLIECRVWIVKLQLIVCIIWAFRSVWSVKMGFHWARCVVMEMNFAGVSFHGTAFVFQLQCCHMRISRIFIESYCPPSIVCFSSFYRTWWGVPSSLWEEPKGTNHDTDTVGIQSTNQPGEF